MGKIVCIIDGDPQCNLTSHLIGNQYEEEADDQAAMIDDESMIDYGDVFPISLRVRAMSLLQLKCDITAILVLWHLP